MDQSDMQLGESCTKGPRSHLGSTASHPDALSNETSTSQKRDASSLLGSPEARREVSKKPRIHTDQENLPPAASTPQRKSTVAITPTASTSKKQIGFDNAEDETESVATSLMLSTVNLPPSVPNLFSPTLTNFTSCQCLGQQCLRGCSSANYMNTYGWEHRALLQEKEDMEYVTIVSSEAAEKDPLQVLTCSNIVPPPSSRTRDQSEWFGPKSINWDLDQYMDRQTDLTPKMRSILVDWIVELSEEYKLSPKTFHLAVTLVDKSLACASQNEDGGFFVPRDMLQCLGCACTWIAAKMEEVEAPSVDDFVYISDNIYRREQILDMEMDVCTALKFHLQHVTPVSYAHEYLLASEAGPCNPTMPTGPAFHPVLRHMVYYLLELSRLSYDLVATKPSLVAASAVYLARATLGIREMSPTKAVDSNGYWTKTLEFYSSYSVEELKDTVRVLLHHQREAETSNLKAVFNKYRKDKFMYVSTKTVLNHEQLDLYCFISNNR